MAKRKTPEDVAQAYIASEQGQKLVLALSLASQANRLFSELLEQGLPAKLRLNAEPEKINGKRGKQKAIKDPNAPKQPKTAYILFLMNERKEILKEHPEAALPDVTKAVAAKWNTLSAEEKQPYIDAAAAEKEKYAAVKEKYDDDVKHYKETLGGQEPPQAPAKKRRRKQKEVDAPVPDTPPSNDDEEDEPEQEEEQEVPEEQGEEEQQEEDEESEESEEEEEAPPPPPKKKGRKNAVKKETNAASTPNHVPKAAPVPAPSETKKPVAKQAKKDGKPKKKQAQSEAPTSPPTLAVPGTPKSSKRLAEAPVPEVEGSAKKKKKKAQGGGDGTDVAAAGNAMNGTPKSPGKALMPKSPGKNAINGDAEIVAKKQKKKPKQKVEE
ncbi:High mobility group protein 20A [Borealophlyctis nickersoniae]|nr:High mobility group protein 20A [Borealophlyctis nickersoniae]